MIKTLGLKKTTSVVVIYQTLKTVQKKFSKYDWYIGFKNVLSEIEKFARLEKKGQAISKEQRDYIFEKLSKFQLHSSTFLDSTKVYDFNELKEKYKQDATTRSEMALSNMADSVESMAKLQDDYLPKCNKRLGYGIKSRSGILFYTKFMRQFEISRAFERVYMVYPGWVAERVPTAVVYIDGLTDEQLAEKLKEIESNFEGKKCVAGQTRGKYRYYALLPENIDLAIVKLYVLGKVYISDKKVSSKMLEQRDELKRVANSIHNELEVVEKCLESISLQLRRLTIKRDDLKSALSSPTVKLSDVANKISIIEGEIEKCKKAKSQATEEKRRLTERQREIVEKAKALR